MTRAQTRATRLHLLPGCYPLPGMRQPRARPAGRHEREAATPPWDNSGTVRPCTTTPTVADRSALRGGRDRLLQAGEVAEQLGVCATVYRLCERGELPHVRIVNSIRVRPRDLAAFVAGLGRSEVTEPRPTGGPSSRSWGSRRRRAPRRAPDRETTGRPE